MLSGFNKPLSVDALTKYLDKKTIEVGLLDNAPDYDDGTDIQVVGHANEYGGDLGSPPARHWLKKSVEADEKEYKLRIAKILKHEAGATRNNLFHELGRYSVDMIQSHLENNDIGLLSNKESTQKRKGGDTPMLDSQHLIRAIDSRVVDGK